jgi:hypothetical protein
MESRHVDVDASPVAASALLGERLEWIVTGGPPPVDRLVRSADIEGFIKEIEAL